MRRSASSTTTTPIVSTALSSPPPEPLSQDASHRYGSPRSPWPGELALPDRGRAAYWVGATQWVAPTMVWGDFHKAARTPDQGGVRCDRANPRFRIECRAACCVGATSSGRPEFRSPAVREAVKRLARVRRFQGDGPPERAVRNASHIGRGRNRWPAEAALPDRVPSGVLRRGDPPGRPYEGLGRPPQSGEADNA
jgi:hypothetical protein